MFRNLFRRGISVLVLILVLAGALPAVAQPSASDRWEGIWGWLVSFWYEGEADGGNRGLGADPNGLTSGGDRGLELDPDGLTDEGDRGLELDPNG